ncbi:MAG: DUF4349 domain-containing protein [Oscillospiraceae bacterium]
MFKKIGFIFITIALTLAVTACSAKSSDKSANFLKGSSQAGGAESNSMMADEAPMEGEAKLTSISPEQLTRKVILRANFEVQTKDYDKTIDDLNSQIVRTKSYIQSSDTYGDKNQGDARANLLIRVPSSEYEQFKLDVQKLGNIISSSEGGEDVTGDYFDKDARIAVLKAQEKRVVELLEKAQTIEDILKIEAELTRIRAEIEQLTTVVKRYDDLISYATITVNIYQTSDYITKDDSFFAKIATTMKNSLQFGLSLLQNMVYILVWLSPYLILLGMVAITVLSVLRKRKAKRIQEIPPQQQK